ncbi:hypothetical protein [Bacillus cereus]|uniref:hypothetical protein n=1 Tax=Bacillus cereus TaxID=1396 RepID=UPI00283A9E0C|nr:hypothetical protein [Bacillus cereus]
MKRYSKFLEGNRKVPRRLEALSKSISDTSTGNAVRVGHLPGNIESFSDAESLVSRYLSAVKIVSKLEEIQEKARITEEKTERFKTIMIEIGFPPHGGLFPQEVSHLVDLYDEQGGGHLKGIINKFMIERYNAAELEVFLQGWQAIGWISNRHEILSSAIKAHIEGDFFLTVPIFLAQIEGVIAQGFAHHGRMGGNTLQQYLETLLVNEGVFSFDKQIQTFYLNTILVGFEHGEPLQSKLSRNAILHGADVEYGTEENSLKSILIFDYILDRLNENRIAE